MSAKIKFLSLLRRFSTRRDRFNIDAESKTIEELCDDAFSFINPNLFTLSLYNCSKFEKDVSIYTKSVRNTRDKLIYISYDRSYFITTWRHNDYGGIKRIQ